MRSQMVSQLFVEIGDDGRIVSCASGNDPTLALNFACARVGGKIVNGLCSMDDWGKAQVARAVGEYYTSVRADYFNQIHAETSARISVAAAKTLKDSVDYSNGQMDQVSTELNGTIGSRDLTSNNNLAIVNNQPPTESPASWFFPGLWQLLYCCTSMSLLTLQRILVLLVDE